MHISHTFEWAVIGAGPAGIAAIGKLLDQNISSEKIAWIDPHFQAGDFGTKWINVSSNTKVKLFLKFFQECRSFEYSSDLYSNYAIYNIDPEETCLLGLAAKPLKNITDLLKTKVSAFQHIVQHLKLYDRHWVMTLSDHTVIRAKNVVLATGADPKSLAYPGIAEISLETALNPEKLKLACNPHDIIAVFGASHSAIIILRSLLETCNVKQIINFYLSPLRYAVYLDDWILFDDTGLKGHTAQWAREFIDGVQPKKLKRVISVPENIQLTLPECTKAIYATGFQRRLIPVEGMAKIEYNDRNGIIAPGLFGLGIAFPEAKTDPYGTLEYRVGLWKFMEYLNLVLPLWLKYGN